MAKMFSGEKYGRLDIKAMKAEMKRTLSDLKTGRGVA